MTNKKPTRNPREQISAAAPPLAPLNDEMAKELLAMLTPNAAGAAARTALQADVGQIDKQAATYALGDADRQALAALGTSQELLGRILARVRRQRTPRTPSATSTQILSGPDASTQITDRPRLHECTLEYGQLVNRARDCEALDALSWTCDYQMQRVIGRGGQGVVFLTACRNEHNLPKALKVFSPEPYGDVQSYYRDMDRMAQVASRVYSIQVDNLVTIERFAYHEGICVMIMRWIDGHDLARLVQPLLLEKLHGCVDEGRWTHLNKVVVTTPPGTVQLQLMPGMAVNIIEKCLRALDALHSHGIVHGDIKPSNIMLDRYGSIRLVDIGSAFELLAPPRRHTWTPRYAPPEVFEGGQWTPQSDLASLGYVLIELLSGQPIFTKSDVSVASTRSLDSARDQGLLEEKRRLPERLHEILPPHVLDSPQLLHICRRLVHPDPSQRFVSAEAALEGPGGTYPFLQELTRMKLSVHFAQEIKRWLADVKKVLP